MLRIFMKYNFEWFSFLRVQYIDDDIARMMRDSGCKGVYLGMESSNDALGSGGDYRFGFTAYAVRLLQDVYFLDWAIDPGTTQLSASRARPASSPAPT